MSKRKGIQLIVILLLAITLGFTSTAAFAYWTNTVVSSNVTIEFTEEEASLDVHQSSAAFEGMLVPSNYAWFEGEVEQVTIVYEISIDKTLVKEVNLVVEALNITIGGSDVYSELVNVTINGTKDKSTNDLYNSIVYVTVVVTISEPIDALEASEKGLDESLINVEDSVAAYEAIYGQTIAFDLKFSVEPKLETE
ncbi:MAG: hypothetical protein WCR19_02330 [Acholeplasmataceae bacterium]